MSVARVREPRVRDRDAAAQRRVRRQPGVGLRVDPRDEERRDGPHGIDGEALRDAALEPAQVGLDHLFVAIDGEQQRHVDVGPAGGQLLDRAHAGLGRRDLDHHVGQREPLPQPCRLGDRRLGVMREIRGAFERDEALGPGAGLVDRAERAGRAADIAQPELEEQLLRIADAGIEQDAQLAVVGARAGDRPGEDRRVRRGAGDRSVADQRRERAAVEQVARERVQPDRDSGLLQALQSAGHVPRIVDQRHGTVGVLFAPCLTSARVSEADGHSHDQLRPRCAPRSPRGGR